jgi:4-amino-4-deoxy-L-arabinose transferase-like glycosyltransferase
MTRKSNKHESIVVIGLFILSLVVSAVFWSLLPAGFRDNQSTDYQNHYEPVARAVLAGQGITLEGEIATRYPPGFSLLLAGAFGIGELFNLDDEIALLAFRLFFAGLSVVLVYALGRLIWPSALAFIPALAWLTYPFFLWLTKQPNSEVPFVPFLYASLFVFWLAALHKPRAWGLYLVAGLLAGATMLIRPSALGLGVLMAGLVLVLGHRMLTVRARFWAAGLVLMGNLLAVLPWEASVYARTGHVIPLSSGGAITIQDGLTFLAVPKEYRREIRIPDDVAALMWTFHERRPEMSSTGGAAAVVLDEARRNPAAFIKLMAIKVARSWYGIDSRVYELPTILIQCIYLALFIWGTSYAIRQGGDVRRMIAGNWLVVFNFWAMTVLVIPLFRYMLPVMGLLMLALPGVYLSLQARRQTLSLPSGQRVNSDY